MDGSPRPVAIRRCEIPAPAAAAAATAAAAAGRPEKKNLEEGGSTPTHPSAVKNSSTTDSQTDCTVPSGACTCAQSNAWHAALEKEVQAQLENVLALKAQLSEAGEREASSALKVSGLESQLSSSRKESKRHQKDASGKQVCSSSDCFCSAAFVVVAAFVLFLFALSCLPSPQY
jgi:hypothetical protein